jgi:tRNA(fMet)-specific endonuclease VapC
MEKMGQRICLDTTFLVKLLRNNTEAINWIIKNNDKIKFYTTVITIYELFRGAYLHHNTEKKLKSIGKIINSMPILNLSLESIQKAAEIDIKLSRKGKLIEIRDLFIGCIALTNKCALKTHNEKHFERIKGLQVI